MSILTPPRGAFGRRVPTDWAHVERHPLRRSLAQPPATVETTLRLPAYRMVYNQGELNACVGFGCSWMMSIINRHQYNPVWLWENAKAIDEWPETNMGDNEG